MDSHRYTYVFVRVRKEATIQYSNHFYSLLIASSCFSSFSQKHNANRNRGKKQSQACTYRFFSLFLEYGMRNEYFFFIVYRLKTQPMT